MQLYFFKKKKESHYELMSNYSLDVFLIEKKSKVQRSIYLYYLSYIYIYIKKIKSKIHISTHISTHIYWIERIRECEYVEWMEGKG